METGLDRAPQLLSGPSTVYVYSPSRVIKTLKSNGHHTEERLKIVPQSSEWILLVWVSKHQHPQVRVIGWSIIHSFIGLIHSIVNRKKLFWVWIYLITFWTCDWLFSFTTLWYCRYWIKQVSKCLTEKVLNVEETNTKLDTLALWLLLWPLIL